jgi:hypothetical protein
VNRFERGLLPPTAYTTYTIAVPLATHWRAATCSEVDCPQWLNGWQSLVDEATELGQQQAYYIRHDRTRRHTETRTPEGLTAFTFEPGQQCYAASSHRIQNGRPERYIQRSGDHRGNPDGRVTEHTGAAPWVDSFGENQERLADAAGRG